MIERIASLPHNISLVSSFFHEELFSQISRDHPLVVIMDHHIERLLFPELQQFLISLNFSLCVLSFPPGESSKQWQTFLHLHQQLLHAGISSASTLLAIGGGVTLDLAGFLAATYHRGIPCIFIPTTLMAMIDASIGGKNGINIHHVKNQMGTFYLPQDVWIIPPMLRTLPQQEWCHGTAEAIKHGLIIAPDLWSFLSLHRGAIFTDSSLLHIFLKKNCCAKAHIVSQDMRDKHQRRLLNFGHTIGHALEATSRGMIPHGFAVSVGMVLETKLSLLTHKLQAPHLLIDLQNLLRIFHLPTTLKELCCLTHLDPSLFTPRKLMSFAHKDKKNTFQQRITIVGIEDLGKPIPDICFSPDSQLTLQLFKEEFHALCDN